MMGVQSRATPSFVRIIATPNAELAQRAGQECADPCRSVTGTRAW